MIEVRELEVELFARDRAVRAVRSVSLSVERGRALAVVGASGAGKTALILSIARLLPRGRSRVSGSVRVDGQELLELTDRQMRAIRGARLGVVFQEPGGALDPLMRVGAQISECVRAGGAVSAAEARERTCECLAECGFSEPLEVVDAFPHQLSLGMRQRAVVAMALVRRPTALLLDEPTSSLDGPTAVGLMSMLEARRRARDLTSILVTHDLGLAAHFAEALAVMHEGAIVEQGPTREVLASPAHPYTRALVAVARRRLRARSQP